MAIGEALIGIKGIADTIHEARGYVDLADNIMQEVVNTLKELMAQSLGAMVDVLQTLWERLKKIFDAFIAGIRRLCDIIVNAMTSNETTDREGANALKGVIS